MYNNHLDNTITQLSVLRFTTAVNGPCVRARIVAIGGFIRFYLLPFLPSTQVYITRAATAEKFRIFYVRKEQQYCRSSDSERGEKSLAFATTFRFLFPKTLSGAGRIGTSIVAPVCFRRIPPEIGPNRTGTVRFIRGVFRKMLFVRRNA